MPLLSEPNTDADVDRIDRRLDRVEVLLRNALDEILIAQFGRDWDSSPAAERLFDRVMEVVRMTKVEYTL